ncbi:ATP-binding cassette domain-containing protein, partial [Streptomyces lavendulocolor]|uniref:ATP-binding cassette domain-containing protein n=1 Tax=Streptomyces lavendulocolor TaxID=67316 RepID=UPI0033DE2A66
MPDRDEARHTGARHDEARRPDALVELRNVDKHFGALHVLRSIDLTVGRGEVVVVIGPSGGGKSTLCRAINRLETVDSGEILIDGKPLPAEQRGGQHHDLHALAPLLGPVHVVEVQDQRELV